MESSKFVIDVYLRVAITLLHFISKRNFQTIWNFGVLIGLSILPRVKLVPGLHVASELNGSSARQVSAYAA
jgi:hypothetical protein